MNKLTSNIVIIILIYLNSNFILAQESKLTLNSTSIGIGLIGSSSETSGGGLSISLDLSTKLNKSLFSIYLNSGSELNLFDAEENYTEISLTYGRQIELNNWIKLEGHLGLGYFNYSVKNGSTNFTTNKESTIGFPFRVKLIFYTGKHFGIGINPNMNLNSLVNTYSGNIIFQYRF
jgi:hypothetical protein